MIQKSVSESWKTVVTAADQKRKEKKQGQFKTALGQH